MKKSYLLGIDIGTSACKVAVFDREGRVLAAANGAYPVYYPHEGWAEQNPEEWWSAVCQATEETIQKAGIAPEEIAGVGIDGQSWSAIAIDQGGKVLTNTPIWMDTRAQSVCDRLIVIDHGEILFIGKPEELILQARGHVGVLLEHNGDKKSLTCVSSPG